MSAVLLIEKLPIEILKRIESFNIKYDPYKHNLIDLSKAGNLDGIKWIIKNKKYCSLHSLILPFFEACEYGHLEIVEYLCSILGSQLYNKLCPYHFSEDWLIYRNIDWAFTSAICGNYIKVVKYLGSLGADVHVSDDYIFMIAVEQGFLEIVKYMVSMGVNVHKYDSCALEYAARGGNLDTVKYLVSFGSDMDVNNKAIQCAKEYGNLEIVNYLGRRIEFL